jgi:purine-nucleoside phosphorylase
MFDILHHAASIYHSISHIRHTLSDAHEEMATNHPSAIFNRCVETVEHLRVKLPEELAQPRVAIVCGSGLGGLAECINKDGPRWEIDYKDVPNFPVPSGKAFYKFCDGLTMRTCWRMEM